MKTAPACPDKAVQNSAVYASCREMNHMPGRKHRNPVAVSAKPAGFDYGLIPRAEMRQIVLEMIG